MDAKWSTILVLVTAMHCTNSDPPGDDAASPTSAGAAEERLEHDAVPRSEPAREPPPTATASAEQPIGEAWLEPDGTLVVTLRAEGPGGAIGHAQVRTKPGEPKYERWMGHLGGVRPGEKKLVPPWPE
jgi:hypothetical protein